MSEIREIIAKSVLEQYGSTTPQDIVDETDLDSARNVWEELESIRDDDLLTTDHEKRDIPRYYQTYELENKYQHRL